MNNKKTKQIIQGFDSVILLDTCAFIDIETGRNKKTAYNVLIKVVQTESCICITDLSFFELILGCDTLENLHNHNETFKGLDVLIYVTSDKTETVLKQNIFDTDSIESLIYYKKRINKIKKEILFSIFKHIYNTYSSLFLVVLNYTDKKYWDYADHLFNDYYVNKKSVVGSIVKEAYDKFFENQEESKKILYNLFCTLLIYLLPFINEKKYKEKELISRLSVIKIEKMMTKVFYSLNLKKAKGRFSYIKPMMEYLMAKAKFDSIIDEILFDGVNYIVLHMLFTGANFDSHDIIDLVNLSNVTIKNHKIIYYTNETKWKDFFVIEKEINSNFSQLNPQIMYNDK